jgi:Ca2+-binding RTX toxin-like protein
VELSSYVWNTLSFHDIQTFEPSAVSKIVFVGHGDRDWFKNTTSEPCQIIGGGHDDVLIGGNGADRILGGAGNDTIFGFSGDDYITDSIGFNKLYGGGGYDRLFGGKNDDVINGGSEADTIVSIGGGKDTITGGPLNDYVWMDTIDVMTDISSAESGGKYIHKVNQFLPVSYSGGITSTPVSKELLGQNLIDPVRMHKDTTLKNFKTNPLFASDGPSMDDVFQGEIGDCYFVASLSAIAKARPEIIKKMVVDLGDGTYAVRFYRNGTPTFVRVDADLWVQNGVPIYAGLGHEGSTWVAIIEKAYCFFRRQTSSYLSIVSGDGSAPSHLGLTSLRFDTRGFVTADQFISWDNTNRPAGSHADEINGRAIALLNWARNQLALGRAVCLGAHFSYGNSMSFIDYDNPSTKKVNEITWRRGQHVFVVDEVLTNTSGTPTGIVVRNPWGDVGPNGDGYITVTDLAVIYFAHSGASAYVV